MNAYVAGGAALLWLASLGGAYAYRAHQDAGLVDAQETKDALETARMVQVSMQASDKITAAAQTEQDARAADLQAQLDQSRSQYANLKPIHISSCPVPLADVRMLVAAPAASGGDLAASAGAGPGHPDTGTVAAGDLITACRQAKYTFDRNIDRLNHCVAAYDSMRAVINAGPPKAP